MRASKLTVERLEAGVPVEELLESGEWDGDDLLIIAYNGDEEITVRLPDLKKAIS